MTERAGQSTRARRARPGGALAAAWAAAAAFLLLLALLATRLATGQDPALRARAPVPSPRRILVRRIYLRKVIVHLPASAPPHATEASQQLGTAGAYGSVAPVTRSS